MSGVSPLTVVRVLSSGEREGKRPHKAMTQSISPALAATMIFLESVKNEEGGEVAMAEQGGRQRACARSQMKNKRVSTGGEYLDMVAENFEQRSVQLEFFGAHMSVNCSQTKSGGGDDVTANRPHPALLQHIPDTCGKALGTPSVGSTVRDGACYAQGGMSERVVIERGRERCTVHCLSRGH